MTWELARVTMTCGYCGSTRAPIAVGEPVLFISTARKPRCVDCAKRMFHTEPPTSWSTKESEPHAEAPVVRLFSLVGKSKPSDFDHRMAAAGAD